MNIKYETLPHSDDLSGGDFHERVKVHVEVAPPKLAPPPHNCRVIRTLNSLKYPRHSPSRKGIVPVHAYQTSYIAN